MKSLNVLMSLKFLKTLKCLVQFKIFKNVWNKSMKQTTTIKLEILSIEFKESNRQQQKLN